MKKPPIHLVFDLPIVALGALLAVACSGEPRVITPGTLPPSGPPRDSKGTYAPLIQAKTSGTVRIAGTVRNKAFEVPATGKANELLVRIETATGTEQADSCGVPGVRSQSRAEARVVPTLQPVTRVYGFTLSTEVSAQGGFWREKVGGVCQKSRIEKSMARAEAAGQIELRFEAPPGITDRLVVWVSGNAASDAAVEVAQATGELLPLSRLPEDKGRTVELPRSGFYLVRAKLAANTEGVGAGSQSKVGKELTVSVQSLRDALSLGPTNVLTEKTQVPVPVFLPLQELDRELHRALFDLTDGKFWPCSVEQGCDERATQVFVEQPDMRITGGGVAVDFRLHEAGGAGTKKDSVTGRVLLTGTPKIQDRWLVLESLAIEPQSLKAVRKFLSEAYAQHLVKAVQAKTRLPVEPYLKQTLAALEFHLPARWGNACLLLDTDHLVLTSVQATQDPEGIVAMYQTTLTLAEGNRC